MSTPPDKRPLADVLDELVAEEDLADFQAMDPAKLAEELAQMGYDAARTRARVDGLLAKTASAPAAAPAAEGAKPLAKVVDLGAVRARRATRWTPLLVAAAAAMLLLGGGGATYLATRTPDPTPTGTVPTGRPTPPPEALAALKMKDGLRQCDLGYFGECWDSLDEAAKLDPKVADDPKVKQARKSIEDAFASHPPGGGASLFSKPHLGPGERPLRPKR